MSKETNDQNSNKNLGKSDLNQTIEFTEEEKRQLRHANQQPLDQDYFAKSLDEDKQVEIPADTPSESTETDKVSNEFRYKSIHEREITTETKAKKNEIPKKKKKQFLNDLFKPTYEEHYDLNELDDITSYNQFQEDQENKDESFFTSFKSLFKKETENEETKESK